MGIIRFENVTKVYKKGLFKKEISALNGLSLSIKKGEIYGFIGPNGAGKSTAIKILAGIIYPSSGSAYIDGISVLEHRSRANIGFLPESPRFYDYLTAYEFMKLIASLSNLNTKFTDTKNRIYECLDLVGLNSASHRRIRQFSLGMMQRLGIAQTILGDCDILVMDEPLSSLDPFGRKDVMKIIEDLKAKGKTIFLTSHIMHDVEKIVTNVGIIKNGILIAQGALSDIVKKNSLEEFFVHEAN